MRRTASRLLPLVLSFSLLASVPAPGAGGKKKRGRPVPSPTPTATPTPTPEPRVRHWIDRLDYPVGTELSATGWVGGQEENGKKDFYFVQDGDRTVLRSTYLPGTEANYIYKEVEWSTKEFPYLRWRWRVHQFPTGAKILDPKLSDAAAQVYVLWKVGRRNYVIKYFWATADKVGDVLRQGNIFFGKLYGLIVRSGGAVNQWHTETRNIHEDFKTAFEEYPKGKVRGIAVLSDADETKTQSEADYADFEYLKSPDE